MLESLASVLPNDEQFSILHLQSASKEVHPLVAPRTKSHADHITTIKTEHFITIAHNAKIFYGLEVYVYIIIDHSKKTTEKLLFVSKADTNGYNDVKCNIKLITEYILLELVKIDVTYYLQSVKPMKPVRETEGDQITKETTTLQALRILANRAAKGSMGSAPSPAYVTVSEFYQPLRTKISLFTRAEPQYLFADSSKNPKKHVLSGAQLLRWWLQVIDSVLVKTMDPDSTVATLQIPGEEVHIVENYLKATSFSKWSVGDVFKGSPQDTAAFIIPLFPDDPKGRFLEHLVVDNRIKSVNLAAFWAELQARQEFRLGVVVSVIGVDGKQKHSSSLYNPSGITLMTNKKRYKMFKDYITGEDYATDEGATESFINVRDYLAKMGTEMLEVRGTWVPPVKRAAAAPVATINNLVVRKKSKQK